MARAKKSKSSKVAEKVEAVKKKSPSKKKAEPKGQTDKEVIEDIIKSLDEEWHHVIHSAHEKSGDDLVKLRAEVSAHQARGGFNFSIILDKIDKYKIVSE